MRNVFTSLLAASAVLIFLGTPTFARDDGPYQKLTAEERLQQNTNLSDEMRSLLPAGTNIQDAVEGFYSLRRFVATVRAALNAKIPFYQLKAKVVSGESLGSAIRQLKPNVRARAEARKAMGEAITDLRWEGSA